MTATTSDAASTAVMAGASALAITGVRKSFSEKPALAGASLDVRVGEVHALVGQNGCGKSTLIKILAGYHMPDSYESATVHGAPIHLGDGQSVRAAGVRFIHQDLGLVGGLDSVDNLALGEQYESRLWLSDRKERAAARRELARYDLDIDVQAPVATLGAARQAFVAIVRALRSGLDDRNVLILDEPTAALPETEVEHLFTLLRVLRARGVAIVLVTHRLGEVLDLADRVTVMRDGQTIVTREVAGLDHDSLATLIIGRSVETFHTDASTGVQHRPVLEVQNLAGGTVKSIDFTIGEGEVVGIAGLVGSGYEDLLGLAFGAKPRTSGQVVLSGAAVGASPAKAVAAGLGYAPADRKALGALMQWSLRENLTLPALRTRVRGWLSERSERTDAAEWLDRMKVVAAPEQGFWTLSGGNQQRVVLGKWLRHNAKVLLLDEPTNGVDVGARVAIYEAIAAAAREGTAFVLASSDAEELAAVCDRVLIMRSGRLADILAGDRLTADAVVAESLKASITEGAQQ